MSKCTYDRLLKLSWDAQYQRALEALFRCSIPEDNVGTFQRQKAAIAVLTVVGIVAAGGLAGLLILAQ
jgi:hypothetical protein